MIKAARRTETALEYYFSRKLKEIATLNRTGPEVINLGIGSPDLAPAEAVINKLGTVAQSDQAHGYQSYNGIKELRESFAVFYSKYYNVVLNSETEILPLIGSKEGITYVSQAFVDEGDEVLIPNPGYPAYVAATRLAGGIVREYHLSEENEWLPDLKRLSSEDLSRIKLMWVNYPHMPTGAKASPDVLQEIVDFARKHNILLCNDNPYSFILNNKPVSILSANKWQDNVLELNSLSKSHNMAGWRVGMVAGPEDLIKTILIVKSNVDSGMFLPIQKAAVEALALDNDWFESLNETYKRRRDIVWQIADLLNCSYSRGQSGLFIWAKVPENIVDVTKWIDEILRESRVFITPGAIFGSNGARYIRISLCSSIEKLKEAALRIKN